jgi:(p)ppGpp synthase/HD superfamily hydrolase
MRHMAGLRTAIPRFAQDSRLLEDAYRFASDAHSSESAGKTEIDHPLLVAELLAGRGFDDRLIAAALLHDVVEDTPVRLDEIDERFGDEVASLVDTLTEDPSILSYRARKAEHRARIAAGGERAATVYAADKVAKLRAARNGGRDLRPAQLRHFAATLDELRAAHPGMPFLAELERELKLLTSVSSGRAA